MCETTDYRLIYYNSLEELYDLYDKVKAAVILVENFDKERKMYIAPINQLRSALDHIFKAVKSASEIKYSQDELKEAKEHLERAGFDALELLAGNLGANIIEKVSHYDNNTLTSVFPDYFRKIRPQIIDIKEILANLRSEKKTDPEKPFKDYFAQIEALTKIDKEVDKMIPSLEEFKKKEEEEENNEESAKKKEKRKNWIIGIVSTIVSGVIVAIITYYITGC